MEEALNLSSDRLLDGDDGRPTLYFVEDFIFDVVWLMLLESYGQKRNSTSAFNLAMLIKIDLQHLYYDSKLHCPGF